MPTRKSWALLAYLVQGHGRDISREELAALLWPLSAEGQARASLRQELAVLRKGLRRAGIQGLSSDHDSVRFSNTSVAIDTHGLEDRLRRGALADLREAAALYVGEFLSGLNVRAEPFEEWLWLERQRLRELALTALLRLLVADEAEATPQQAMATAHALLAIEPAQEDAHRALMRLFVRNGQRAEALQQFERCGLVLKRELDARPSAETTQLAEQIRRNSGAAPPVTALGHRVSGVDGPGAEPRRAELTVLRAGLYQVRGASALDPADLAFAQDQLQARALHVLDPWGGRVVANGAERVLAVFGEPAGARADGGQAVLAALALVADALILPNGRPVQIRAGLARGEVLVWRDTAGGVARLVGSAVQNASRFEHIARDAEVIVSEEVRATLPPGIVASPVTPARHGPDGAADAGFTVQARTGLDELEEPRAVPFRHRKVPSLTDSTD